MRIAQDWDGTPGALPCWRYTHAARHRRLRAGRRPTVTHDAPGLVVVLTGTDPVPRHPDRRAGTGVTAPGMRWSCCKSAAPRPVAQHAQQGTRYLQSSESHAPLPNPPARCGWSWWVICEKRKAPQTLWQAATAARTEGIRIEHIGDALDPALAEQAHARMAQCAHYHWRGGQPHEATLGPLPRPMCWFTPAAWRVEPTPFWRRFAAVRRCWPPAHPR